MVRRRIVVYCPNGQYWEQACCSARSSHAALLSAAMLHRTLNAAF
jgi:hypothetical protein